MTTLHSRIRNEISASRFAFPRQRKLPLQDAAHVRNALARFNQVEGVTDTERNAAWRYIAKAAKAFGVALAESGWRELGHGRKVTTTRHA